MKKIDRTVKKETVYIALLTGIFSVFMQSVFLVIGKWDYTVLLGNLLGAFAAVANFFIMGLSVQSALNKEKKEIQNIMKISQMLRMLMLFAVAVIGYFVPVFNLIAVIIPFIFPRLAVTLRAASIKKETGSENG